MGRRANLCEQEQAQVQVTTTGGSACRTLLGPALVQGVAAGGEDQGVVRGSSQVAEWDAWCRERLEC